MDTDAMARWFVGLGLVLVVSIGLMVNGFGHGHPTFGERVMQEAGALRSEILNDVQRIGH